MNQVLNELEIEKKREEDLTLMRRASHSQHWWVAPIDELNTFQLANLKFSLEKLKQQVIQQANKVVIQSSAPLQYFLGNSSAGEIIQSDPTINISNKNMMLPSPLPPPPLMIQSFANPQDFSRSCSTTGNPHFDPNNFDFNPNNMNVMPSPSMIQSSAPPQYFSVSSSTEGLLDQFEPTDIGSNRSNINMMPPPLPPPPMTQSFAHPQNIPRRSSTRPIYQCDPNNIGFNHPNTNVMASPPIVQSSASPQNYPGSSSIGGSSSAGQILQFNPNNIGFNPHGLSVMPPPPVIHSSTPSQYFSGAQALEGSYHWTQTIFQLPQQEHDASTSSSTPSFSLISSSLASSWAKS